MKMKNLPMKKALRAALFVLLLSIVGTTKMYAYDFSAVCETGQTLYYNITDAENHYVELTYPGSYGDSWSWIGFTKPTGDIILLENVQYDGVTYSVTSIGNSAFSYCTGLTTIEIPNSVTSIGNFAFSNCRGLTTIEIPNSVSSIGNSAFYNCIGLTSIEIPNSVTSIGNWVFSGCIGLTSIEIPNSVTSIGDYTFDGCSGLEQIIVDSGNTVYDSRDNCNAIIKTSINEMIAGCKNTVIPNTVTSINRYAFYNCSGLTSIEIPNSVTNIGYEAFAGCSGLNSITVWADNPPILIDGMGEDFKEDEYWINDIVFRGVKKYIPVYVPCGAVEAYQDADGWNVFTNMIGLCSGEVAVTVNPAEGGAVTGAGYYEGGDICVLTATSNPGYSFGNWTENGVVVSMDSVYSFHAHSTTIVANFCSNSPIVFADANVKNLCVANWDTNGDGELSYAEAATVTDLGEVFRSNSSILSFNELQYFVGLTSINSLAFSYCEGLSSIEIPNSVISIDKQAFQECFGLTSIKIPNSVTTIGNQAFIECTGLTSIEIPNSVTSVGSGVFFECTSLTSVEIPNSVTSISDDMFIYCVSLSSVKIPNSVTYIGSSAFGACLSLTSIEIPNSVTSIDNYAFFDCFDLISIGISNSMTTIGDQVFAGCISLTSIEIPNSVTSLGYNVFERCESLTSITVLADNPPTAESEYEFDFIYTIPVYVPCGSVEAYQNAPGWSEFENYHEIVPYHLSLTSADDNFGTVQLVQAAQCDNPTAIVEAIANEGYAFTSWTEDGEVVSTDAIYSFTLESDRNLVANFEAIPITQTTALTRGWNWYSTYIEQEGIDGLGQLENSIGIPNVRIESKDGDYVRSKVRNGRTVWVGALTSINNEEMYKIGTKTACTATMEGIATDPTNHPITINRGWNWIGFPCDHSVSVSEAMSGFSPKNNDMIKGKSGSATYSNGTWSGTLNTLEPGQGYMYGSKSNATKTLVFQTGSRGEATQANITPENNYYQPAEDYVDNMTVIAVVELDGEEVRSDDYELAAFVSDECRGSVKLMYVEPMNRYVAFLTVFGDESEDLHFVLTDGATSDLSADYMTYATDGIEGTLDEPVVLRFGTSVQDYVNIFPNPSSGVFNIEGKGIRKVSLIDAYGNIVLSKEAANDIMQIDLSSKATGIYMLQVVTGNGITTRRLIKK